MLLDKVLIKVYKFGQTGETVYKRAGQYAYLAGASNEAVMHQILAKIERTLKSGECVNSAILHLEGAFSQVTY